MSSTWLTTKLDRLRPRTVGTGAKELASNSGKSSTSSSSSGKKRKENETDDDHMKQTPKKKKPRHEVKRTLDIKCFSLLKKTYSLTCLNVCCLMIFL